VAVGCNHLSVLHLVDCIAISIQEWLVYLGRHGSLEELVVKDCKEISQYDLLKFGPGWAKLQKFEFEINGNYWLSAPRDPSYVAGYPYSYDIFCENLKDLRLAHIITDLEIGLRSLLGKCKSLETLCLEYVFGLDENEMIALFQSCSNLKSISLRLMPLHCFSEHGRDYRTPLTDDTLMALALNCPMLQVVDLTFTFCSSDYPTEIGFTQKGVVRLIQSCPIRTLVLNGASMFKDSGMKGLSSCPFLETLELVDCKSITDAGMDFIIQAPRFSNLTLRKCKNVTDNGMVALACSGKLESLTVIGCRKISQEGVQGAAKSVHYSAETESHDILKGMHMNRHRK
jgi:F-box/leucine-rich repeat protein 2/20